MPTKSAECDAAAAPSPFVLPIGANAGPEGVRFRLWAPKRGRVSVVFASGEPELALEAEGGGYFSGVSRQASAGTRYLLRLDDDERLYPDPASRFQPEGPFGPSEVVDPRLYEWADRSWPGVTAEGQVIYELHVGTFTPEGDLKSATAQLGELARIGVTVIELMPLADFAGRFGWGYDGVNLFAPSRLYGAPDDLRRFVDRAHGLGVGVILDVVYNHLGPSGNFLPRFAADYFSNRSATDWGEPINFDGENAGPVREFYVANAACWIAEYHLDGLRFDATQNIYDDERAGPHILAEIAAAARAAAGARSVYLVAENEPQEVRAVRSPQDGGFGLDALWNDDFHHAARVALTGRSDGYYTDYRGRPQEFVSAAKHGYLYQGQRYSERGEGRGTPTLGLRPQNFIGYLQNHDQIANSATAERAHQLSSPGSFRAMTALLLLGPWTPMLFQGQEFGASAPFHFFADHEPALAELVQKGRIASLLQFPNMADPAAQAGLAPPHALETFRRCKLDLSERERHAPTYRLHQDLLAVRRESELIRCARSGAVDGAVLGDEAFLLRYLGPGAGDRLLIVNLGANLRLDVAPEPLLAPPEGAQWRLRWHSENPAYGGAGVASFSADEAWRLPARCAMLLAPERADAAA